MENLGKVSGIYQIKNTVNGKFYIGSAVNFRARWKIHQRALNCNRHHSRYLQNSWNEYGSTAFEFKPLLICEKDNLIFYEQKAIDCYQPHFNMWKVANSPLGYPCSPETRALMSASRRGKKFSSEHRANISLAKLGKANIKLRGRVRPEEVRNKISIGNRGKSKSIEHRAKISVARLGQRPTLETREKLSAARKGKSLSSDHCARISAGLTGVYGRKHSAETRTKISNALLGNKNYLNSSYYAKKRAVP